MKTAERKLRIGQNALLGAVLLAIFGVVSVLEPTFASGRNLQNVLQQTAVLGIASLGMTALMISGGLDLSIGKVIGLSACIVTTLVSRGRSLPFALLAGFAAAVACGFINGMLIAKSGGYPFVITLGTMTVYGGVSLLITNGESHSLKSAFQFLGQGNLGIFPVSTLLWVLMAILAYFALRYSKFGRTLYMLGGNERAAFYSGVKIAVSKAAVYTLNGAIVGIASLVLVSRFGSAVPATGEGYELRAIAAVVIGGASLFGGRGSVIGCILGTILMGIISNALNALNVSYFYQGLILGVVIIGASIVSTWGGKK